MFARVLFHFFCSFFFLKGGLHLTSFIYVPKLCACTVFLYMVLACVASPSASFLVEQLFGSLLGADVPAVLQLQIMRAESQLCAKYVCVCESRENITVSDTKVKS